MGIGLGSKRHFHTYHSTMNLPRNGCYCCNEDCCSSSQTTDRIDYLANSCVQATTVKEQMYVLHPSKRKRLSSFSSLRKTTQRQYLNVVFIFSAIFVSLVSLGNTTEISLSANSFMNGESTPEAPIGTPDFPSIPTAASSSLNNVVVPGPSSSPALQSRNSPSETHSYFINGYANQIQKTNVTDLRALAGDKPFQLQFRTVCPFGNIFNDDIFALRFNSHGYLAYFELPQEVQSAQSRSVVTDGKWHSVTFIGSEVYLDDRSIIESGENNFSINWYNVTDNDTNHKINFFDGFVGCVRLQVPTNDSGNPDAPPTPQSNPNGRLEDPFALFKLFSLKGLAKYQPCDDPDFDLSQTQCFDPSTFVLCSKCQNNAKCVFTDGRNECECPEPEDETVQYEAPFCQKIVSPNIPLSDIHPESRELHSDSGDPYEPIVSSTTGSSHASILAQSSSLMSSTTEHVAASSSVDESRLPPHGGCPCENNGRCIPSPTNPSLIICDCEGTGFRGKLCKNDICDENPGICVNGKCFDIPDTELGFECYCKPGFSGDRCDFNFDECLSNPCENNATCVDDVNTFRCMCQDGYDGTKCENDIDECESNPCRNGGKCNNLIADYNCSCVLGYEGTDCEVNIDECELDPCQNNGVCIDLVNDYACNCDDTGFIGHDCENNVDDCESDPCKNNGTCIDGIKDYNCRCFDGYNGTNCEIDVNECESTPCLNNGVCHEKSVRDNYVLPSFVHRNLTFDYATAVGYICDCQPGFEGETCQTDIDECAPERNPNACNGHGLCNNLINDYSCSCNKGFEGEFCENDINECEPIPCEHAKECRNLEGDYACECSEGYGGKNCTVPLTACIQNVCFHEGACTPNYDEAKNKHTYVCNCKAGYTGKQCQNLTTMGFNGSSLAEIVKNDDAYTNNKYYLTFHFRTTLPDVVLAVGQGGTYFYLGLSGGKLNLQSSLINNLLGMSSGNKLHDGAWHRVVVSINSTHAILSADIEQVTLPIAEVEDIPQQPTGFNVTFLGVWKSSFGFLNKQDLNPFVGCMRDVQINDDPVLPEEQKADVNFTNIAPLCVRKDQCSPNPCLSNGVCTDLWQKFTCTCPRPHLGDKCQYAYYVATFNHENTTKEGLSSLATIDIPPGRFGGVFDISMFVRTREQKGTIFLLCDKERGLNGTYIEASVTKNGNLVVLAKWTGAGAEAVDENAGKPESYTVDGQISDGNPHLISVQKDKNFVVIKVDDSEHFRKSHSNKVFSPTVMFIGGKPATYSDQESVVSGVIQEGHSGETSTSLPETPIDNNTEGSATEAEGSLEVFVPEPFMFKGTIQDVRINLSAAEPNPSTLGHTSHPRAPNEYIVEFFNLAEPHSKRLSLGRVTIQNLKKGTVSDDHCKDGPCLHGACSTTWNDFKCDCFDGYDGKRCDKRLPCSDVNCPERSACKNIGHTGFECVADASFDGKGTTTPHYILRSNAPADLTFSKLNFTYRSKPRVRNRGVNVLHISNGTAFLRVTLEDEGNESSIAFRFMNNKKIEIKNSTIFDGEWHSVELRFSSPDSSEFTVGLTYDKTEQVENFEYHSNQYLKDLVLSHNLDIVVGSSLSIDDYGEPVLNDPDHSHNQYYRGCLRNIYIGSLRLPFISPSRLEEVNSEVKNKSKIESTAPSAFYINEKFHTADQQLPRLGCILCYAKDCENGGQCFDPTQSYDCACAAGYEGVSCDKDIDECVDNMCSNGSTCKDGVNNYTCTCATGFEGWLCEVDIDECEGDGAEKCSNHGWCHNGIGEFTCKCDEDYTGIHCDKRKKSTCNDGPCERGATCTDVGLQPNGISFKCNCAPGYEGEFCSERIDYCKSVECENGGSCNNTLYGFQCYCLDGFDGLKCDVNINECSSNPCKNGGSCIDGINAYTCDCDGTGFEGLNCELDVNECDEIPARCASHLICENFKGSYTCSCPDKIMCGSDCDIPNPCYGAENRTCDNGGTCEAQCMDPENPVAACICLPEYTGENCETFSGLKAPADESSVDILLIIIPVLAAILIAATVGIIILVRMARRKRATRGVYSPSQQEYCNPRVELDNVMKPPPEERLI